MARESDITEEYLKEVLGRLNKGREVASNLARRNALVKAGKELALLIVWMQEAKGTAFNSDIPACIAKIVEEDETILKEVLIYYEALKEAPALTKALLKGFNLNVESGELQVHFNWDVLEVAKVKKAGELLQGKA